MKKFGELFKSKRKELSLSLKEVENATSIRINHLESIEEGRDDDFLSPVYMLGFMRQYATFLGLDGDKLFEEHPKAVKLTQDKQDFAYGIGTLEVRGSMGGGVKWLPNLIWASVTVVVIVGAYYLAKYLGVI
ncbi:helix-turn-helix domain-containing protein [Candidatus Neptunichlamydia sp. REUL1]|uniref:helix-turn-helix domain-containing protein n=1 Tax=Candidatus Neptunichlamydia sp. REUL1 TaxID=3064277 RepID=UPI00292EFE8B|nr:helix-turn-helix domain-containing protein [Candidatus Neptunochlamydia sp. REUL1]